MLGLGRAIIAEPNTSSSSDAIMKKLTGFIQDWSDLQLAWQNLYNELHATLEQSHNLSDQLDSFGRDTEELGEACDGALPATVTMVKLDEELKAVQVLYARRLYKHTCFACLFACLSVCLSECVCLFVCVCLSIC